VAQRESYRHCDQGNIIIFSQLCKQLDRLKLLLVTRIASRQLKGLQTIAPMPYFLIFGKMSVSILRTSIE
jgi:hypothetical protein